MSTVKNWWGICVSWNLESYNTRLLIWLRKMCVNFNCCCCYAYFKMYKINGHEIHVYADGNCEPCVESVQNTYLF